MREIRVKPANRWCVAARDVSLHTIGCDVPIFARSSRTGCRDTVPDQPLIDIDLADLWIADGPHILREISWQVMPGEHWALIGPNGSGKTTLLSLAGAQRHPSKGRVTILGETLGQTSLWDLRERIGSVDPNQKILDWLTIEEIVMTGQTNTVWPQHGRDTPEAHARANALVALVGCSHLAEPGRIRSSLT